jgi:hypothetical protein
MTSSLIPPVAAGKKYRIVKIDSQMRIFDMTAGQWWAVSGLFLVAILMMMSIDPHWRFGGLPLRSCVFVGMLSFMPLLKMTEIRPLAWWQRRVVSLFKDTEDNLPTIGWHDGATMTVDGTAIYHLKFSLEATNALDTQCQQTVAAALFSSVENSSHEWQLFVPPESGTRSVYLATADLAELTTFKKILGQYVDAAEMASQGDLRNVLYRHLTPSARRAETVAPDLVPGVSDALTLAAAGFEQTNNHLLVDGVYAQAVAIAKLPSFTHFGIIDDIFREDLQASVAIYFNACDQSRVRKDLQIQYRMGYVQNSNAKITPAIREASETIVGLSEGSLTAVDIAVYACYCAQSSQESAEKFAKLNRAIDRFGGVMQSLHIEELNGLMTVLPLGQDRIKRRHRVTTGIASTFAPFVTPPGL